MQDRAYFHIDQLVIEVNSPPFMLEYMVKNCYKIETGKEA